MKRFIVFCIPMVFACSAFSQLVLNPKAGMNISGIEATLEDFEAEGRVGFNIGLDIRVPGEESFYFNPGLHYYSYTARVIKDPGGGQEKLKDESRVHALKIPARLGVRLTGEGGLIGLHARGGVVGTLVTGVKEAEGFEFSKDALNPFTLGADLGVCIEIITLLTVDLNFELGLTDYFEDVEGANNVFTISGGLKF